MRSFEIAVARVEARLAELPVTFRQCVEDASRSQPQEIAAARQIIWRSLGMGRLTVEEGLALLRELDNWAESPVSHRVVLWLALREALERTR